jgi:hypothetical protein
MSRHGWATLEHLASDASSPHHFRALELLLVYGYGKPTQPIINDTEAPPMQVTLVFERPNQEALP